MSRAERREARRQIAPDPRPVVDAEDYEALQAEVERLRDERDTVARISTIAMRQLHAAIVAERLAHLGTVFLAAGVIESGIQGSEEMDTEEVREGQWLRAAQWR